MKLKSRFCNWLNNNIPSLCSLRSLRQKKQEGYYSTAIFRLNLLLHIYTSTRPKYTLPLTDYCGSTQRRAEFGIMSPMKKCKVNKMPNGRPEVEVGVQRRRSDIAPMTVKVDLDALRAAAARMKKAQVR